MKTRNRELPEREPDPGPSVKKPKLRKSRRNEEEFLVGDKKVMSVLQLPLRSDVIRHYLQLSETMGNSAKREQIIRYPLSKGFR